MLDNNETYPSVVILSRRRRTRFSVLLDAAKYVEVTLTDSDTIHQRSALVSRTSPPGSELTPYAMNLLPPTPPPCPRDGAPHSRWNPNPRATIGTRLQWLSR